MSSIPTISPQQLAERCRDGKIDLVDVRTPVEFQEIHVEQAPNVPLDRLDPAAVSQAHSAEGGPLYVICRSGSRGRQACDKLVAAGVTDVGKHLEALVDEEHQRPVQPEE
jgi:rhodanese-related sulfurtransferase